MLPAWTVDSYAPMAINGDVVAGMDTPPSRESVATLFTEAMLLQELIRRYRENEFVTWKTKFLLTAMGKRQGNIDAMIDRSLSKEMGTVKS